MCFCELQTMRKTCKHNVMRSILPLMTVCHCHDDKLIGESNKLSAYYAGLWNS